MRHPTSASLALALLAIGCAPVPVASDYDDVDDDGQQEEGEPGNPEGDGEPTEPPPVPPFNPDGAVLEPRHGDVTERGPIAVAGLVKDPDDALTFEYWDASATAWTALTATDLTVEAAAVDGFHAFTATIVVPENRWPSRGLAHLRVLFDNGLPLTIFDGEADACLEAAPTNDARLADCRSFAAAISVVDARTPERGRVLLLDRKGELSIDQTRAYYDEIDAPPTLAEFITRFELDGDDVPSASYFNRGDLGIGREMHCGTYDAENGEGVACYVRNYGEFGGSRRQAIEDTVRATLRGDGDRSFATVAMTYEPPADAPNAVRFIVYDAVGNLLDQAALDTEEDNVSIPNNCLNCHGNAATYSRQRREVTGARFLPFDVAAFDYADRDGFRLEDQQDAFRELNEIFLKTEPPEVHADEVKLWYGGGDVLVGDADPFALPPAWAGPGDAAVYRQVVAPYCRGCHSSRASEIDVELTFATPNMLRQWGVEVVRDVCSPDPEEAMPNAQAALENFLDSPARAYLAGFIGAETMGECEP